MLVALAAFAVCSGVAGARQQDTAARAKPADVPLPYIPPPGAEPAPFPALTGRVVDGADLLDAAEEARLTARLADLQARTKHQFVIVTVTSLGGRTIEDYARDLGNSWGIGRKNVNDGVLLVIAPNERRMNIAVGDGLSGVLTTAVTQEILDTQMLPEFRKGDVAQGVDKGVDAIIAALSEKRS